MAVWSRTSTGAITPALSGNIKNGPGKVRGVRVSFNGSLPSYFQIHDKAFATAFSDSTLLGFGYYLDTNQDTVILDFEEELIFSNGICWAMSSTKNTYTEVDPETSGTSCVFMEWL
jgi:hypothetical protein